jgi:hypothetical protein
MNLMEAGERDEPLEQVDTSGTRAQSQERLRLLVRPGASSALLTVDDHRTPIGHRVSHLGLRNTMPAWAVAGGIGVRPLTEIGVGWLWPAAAAVGARRIIAALGWHHLRPYAEQPDRAVVVQAVQQVDCGLGDD